MLLLQEFFPTGGGGAGAALSLSSLCHFKESSKWNWPLSIQVIESLFFLGNKVV